MAIFTVTIEVRIVADDREEAEEKLSLYKEEIQSIEWDMLPPGTVEFVKAEVTQLGNRNYRRLAHANE